MKVHEQTPDADLLCQESLSFLSEKIIAFFKAQFPGEEVWFPDDTTQWQKSLKAENNVHVVLYGNLLRALTEIPAWPGQSISLWVLCESSKSAIVKILGVKENEVSVIPRSIFQMTQDQPINPTENLVYAGRLSRQKNILDLLYTLYFLQQEHSPLYNLTLYGAFDDEYNQDCGRMLFKETFEQEVTQLVSLLDWKQAPNFAGKKDSLEWPKLLNPKMTLISLSRFLMEDFGVSIAQAQDEGLATIASEWGGYKDIQSKSHYRISSNLLGTDTTPIGARISFARKIAKSIAAHQFYQSSYLPDLSPPAPKLLLREHLNSLHLDFIHKAGPRSVLLSRDQLAAFSDTIEGRNFIKMVHDEFGSKAEQEFIVVVSQLGRISLEENQQIFCELEKNQNCKYTFIDSVQATQKWALTLMIKNQNIMVTKSTLEKFPQLKDHLRNISLEYRILSETLELPLNLNEIKSFEK